MVTFSDDSAPNWATSSFGTPAHASAPELHALGAHLNTCSGPHNGFMQWRWRAQALHHFARPRMVSTLLTMVLLTAALTAAASWAA